MHEPNELIASPAASSRECRARARGWFRDPALWAWAGVGLLALLPLLPLGSALAHLLT